MKRLLCLSMLCLILLTVFSPSFAEGALSVANPSLDEGLIQTMAQFSAQGGHAEWVADDDGADIRLVTYGHLTDLAQKGEILPLAQTENTAGLVFFDALPFGLTERSYRTWFKVNSAAWEKLSIPAPEGTVTWDFLMQAAEELIRYNRDKHANLLLLSDSTRFSASPLFTECKDAREAWQSLQNLVSAKQGESLLCEVVLPLYEVGNDDYVTAVSYNDGVYALSKPEMRCYVISSNTKKAEQAQQFMQLLADNMQTDAAFSGLLSAADTYSQLCAVWMQNGILPPSPENFGHWANDP